MVNVCVFSKRNLLRIAVLILGLTAVDFLGPARAQDPKSGGPIGYELLDEIHDQPNKSYTLGVEVWSTDKEAKELSVTPRTEGTGLEILSKGRTWKGKIPPNRRYKHTVAVRNASGETKTLMIDVKRVVDGRKDTKTISVMVAP